MYSGIFLLCHTRRNVPELLKSKLNSPVQQKKSSKKSRHTLKKNSIKMTDSSKRKLLNTSIIQTVELNSKITGK